MGQSPKGRDIIIYPRITIVRHFNPRAWGKAPKGATHRGNYCRYATVYFNPRAWGKAPKGAHTREQLLQICHCIFQSTRMGQSPKGRDIIIYPRITIVRHFNPRAREGRPRQRKRNGRSQSNFNPRAREGRDNFSAGLANCTTISIHAPVKGATKELTPFYADGIISIHAPVKGVLLPIASHTRKQ